MKYGKFIETLGFETEGLVCVGKGVSTDITREYMHYCYCQENNLISTDGKRLYIQNLKNNDFGFEENKFYKLIKYTTKFAWFVEVVGKWDFPNYKIVLPDEKKKDKEFSFLRGAGRKGDSPFDIIKFYKNMYDDTAINFDYIDGIPKHDEFNVSMYGERNCIKLESENGFTAVIMPMTK